MNQIENLRTKLINFIDLVEKNRLENKLKEKKEIKLYTAYPLKESDLDNLSKNVAIFRNKILTNIVDKNLIAGIVVETNDQVFDFSLRGRLNKLKKIFYEASF
jgi:F0F1-type ATP synthase delta subunit